MNHYLKVIVLLGFVSLIQACKKDESEAINKLQEYSGAFQMTFYVEFLQPDPDGGFGAYERVRGDSYMDTMYIAHDINSDTCRIYGITENYMPAILIDDQLEIDYNITCGSSCSWRKGYVVITGDSINYYTTHNPSTSNPNPRLFLYHYGYGKISR